MTDAPPLIMAMPAKMKAGRASSPVFTAMITGL